MRQNNQGNDRSLYRSASVRTRGSAMLYVVVGLALLGLLIASLTAGTKRAPQTVQYESTLALLQNDMRLVTALIQECIINYPDPVDLDGNNIINAADNPNAPYPVYNNLSTGDTSVPLEEIRCPGAPTAQQKIFDTRRPGRYLQLWSNPKYDIRYTNSVTEGILITIENDSDPDYWQRVRETFDSSNTPCSAEHHNSTDEILHIWIKRNPTSASTEPGCP